jgi:hypothetical protein
VFLLLRVAQRMQMTYASKLKLMLSESRLEGGVNKANLKFINLSTTTSRVSVRNINESEREGAKTNRGQIKSETP